MHKLFFALIFVLSFCVSVSYGQPTTAKPDDAPFLMVVEDTFYMNGIGTIAIGTVERGTINNNDPVELVGIKPTKASTARMVTDMGGTIASAKAGDKINMILRGVEKTDLERGQVIAKPGSIKAVTKFKATFDLLSTADGGRGRPVESGFRPLLGFRNASASGEFVLSVTVAPGIKGSVVNINLFTPTPVEKGQKFTISDLGKTIGTGTVTEIIE